MSKQTLLSHLTAQGKNMSWEQLASIHSIKTGEAARNIWKRYRFSNDTLKRECVKEAVSHIYQSKESKLAKLINECKSPTHTARFEIFDVSPKTQLVEIAFPDLHIGKLAWDKETGEDYDITIAVQRCKEAVNELVSRLDSSKVERILLPLGNDFIQIDNKMSTTTQGTPQSTDGRFGKMFSTAKALVIDIITDLVKIAPVDILIVPGNHDEMTMFTLGEVLEAWYKDDANVHINNSPKLRKYYQYGTNMLVFTHGDKEKHNELGLIAAHEEPVMWGQTRYREVHLGHLHKSKSVQYTTGDEFPGFKIRILPSLSGTDAWHHAKGFLSMKAAKAFIFDKTKGLITEHTYNVLPIV